MINFLYCFCFLTTGLGLYFFIKYKKLKTKTTDLFNGLNKPLRRGYYKKDLTNTTSKDNFESLIYVVELDRFINGQSKIKIETIEFGIDEYKLSHKNIENFIRGKFKSIVDTTDIIWLDSEQSIKEMRKNKLENLKKILKK